MSTPDNLTIKSKFRDYALSFTEDFASSLAQKIPGDAVYLVDKKVGRLYQDKLKTGRLKERAIYIEAVESNKTLDFCYELIQRLVKDNVRRNTTLIAIGGGIIQDIVAFTSSILYRGVEWAFFPTTLLAQADSCVGSKTSINLKGYKNLLGNFYPPSKIFIDLKFLETLSREDLKSGIGEILHFYFVAGCPKAEDILRDYSKLLRSPELFKEHILASLAIKKQMVEVDEFDRGPRRLFNYGHTFGHAVEAISRYQVPHGQAVTLGMDLANYVSFKRGMLSQKNWEAMHRVVKVNLPDYQIKANQMEDYFMALAKDKKNTDAQLTCILTEGPGAMKVAQVPLDVTLKETVVEYFRVLNKK